MKKILTIMMIFIFIFTSVSSIPAQTVLSGSTVNKDENIDATDKSEFDFLPDEELIKLTEPISREEYCKKIIQLYEYLINESTGKAAKIELSEKRPFIDTSDEYILKAYNLGLILGKGNGYFKPKDKQKLGETAVILYKTLKLVNPEIIKEVGKLNIKGESKINSWAAEAMSYLTSHNIITADGKGDLDLNDTVTVEDASQILFRAAKYTEKKGNDAGDALTNYLIYGYHVINNGQINSAGINLRAPILNPSILKTMSATSKSSSTSILDTISNKASDLCNKLNAGATIKYKGVLFSGSLETDFSITNKMSLQQKLIKHVELHSVAEKYLIYDEEKELSAYLSPGFKKAIANLNFEGTYEKKSDGTFTQTSLNKSDEKKCNEIFDKYGTHLITRYTLGGRLELNFTSQNTSDLSDEQIKIAANAAYRGASVDVNVENINNVQKLKNNSTLTFRGIGGIGITGSTFEEISKQYIDWVKSIKDNPDICYVNNFNNSMIPIWNLIEDKGKAAALELAFENISLKRDRTINGYDFKDEDLTKYITDIIVVNGKKPSEAKSKIPNGYNIVCINTITSTVDNSIDYKCYLDANNKARGPYVYIGYLLGNDKSRAITSLGVMTEKDSNKKTDFTKIDGDLNYKAGGVALYLYYKRSEAKKPLTAISGYYGKQPPTPEGWEKPDPSLDLNKGVTPSGDAILIVRR